MASHHVMDHPAGARTMTILAHSGKSPRKGQSRALLKPVGLAVDEFVALIRWMRIEFD